MIWIHMKKKLQIWFMFFKTQPHNSFVKKKPIFLTGILKVICIHSHLAHGQGFCSKGQLIRFLFRWADRNHWKSGLWQNNSITFNNGRAGEVLGQSPHRLSHVRQRLRLRWPRVLDKGRHHQRKHPIRRAHERTLLPTGHWSVRSHLGLESVSRGRRDFCRRKRHQLVRSEMCNCYY